MPSRGSARRGASLLHSHFVFEGRSNPLESFQRACFFACGLTGSAGRRSGASPRLLRRVNLRFPGSISLCLEESFCRAQRYDFPFPPATQDFFIQFQFPQHHYRREPLKFTESIRCGRVGPSILQAVLCLHATCFVSKHENVCAYCLHSCNHNYLHFGLVCICIPIRFKLKESTPSDWSRWLIGASSIATVAIGKRIGIIRCISKAGCVDKLTTKSTKKQK